MSTVFIIGHGGTFNTVPIPLPEGMTVTTYVEPGMQLPGNRGIEVLSAKASGYTYPSWPSTGTTLNYGLSALDNEEARIVMTAAHRGRANAALVGSTG